MPLGSPVVLSVASEDVVPPSDETLSTPCRLSVK
jgi:hypothetical protein